MIVHQAPSLLNIAPMVPEDLPEIMGIERDCHVEPWSEQFFLEELEKPHSSILVAREHTRKRFMLGYICFWHVADEIQVFNLAVHVACRRRGIGRALLLEALQQGYTDGARVALLEVRRSNVVAQGLYTSLGFRPAGVRPNYYGGALIESAVLMELEMTKSWKSQWLIGPDRFGRMED
jgi:ribosomal-protein-alanine N-acetyltransferase